MIKKYAALSFMILQTVLFGQALDVAGFKIVQANAALTITLPSGTKIEPGGYLIVGRNATQSAFETFWNVTLGSKVKYINGFDVVGSNGFPTINGAETYTLYNGSNAVLDGATIGLTVGKAYERTDISGSAGSAATWTEVAQTAATPGTGIANTNTGKLVISEFSDASSFSNEFVELYYDVTPAPTGVGSVSITPSLWAFNAAPNLKFVVKTGSDTIRAIKFVKPSLLSWLAGNISVQPDSAFVRVDGDTTFVSNISLLAGSLDSVIITIGNVAAADSSETYTFGIQTSEDTVSYLNIETQPQTVSYSSPRPMNWVKSKDGSGVPISNGKWVVVKGIVTAANEFGGPTYLQDETGGIAVYDSSVSNNVNRGDEVILLGMVSPYNEMFELNPCSVVEKVSEGNMLDTLQLTIAQIKGQPQKGVEPFECRLIRVNNIEKVLTTGGSTTASWTTTSSGTNYELISGSDTLEIRVVTKTNLANTSTPSTAFDVVGVLGQFNTYYQIIPRSVDDIIVEGAGPRITSSTPYEKNITPTSLTFTWTTDAPGTSLVNYGTTSGYGSSFSDPTAVLDHSITISSLEPATVYHVQIGTADGGGTTYTNDYIVSTASQTSTGVINVYFNQPVNSNLARGEAAQTLDISQKLIARINAASYSIDAAFYSLSGTVGANIATALIAAKNRGVEIRVIGEYDNTTAPWTTLTNGGITVIKDNYDATNAGDGLMHNKFVVFDNRNAASDSDDWVWTGSWNATDPGNADDAQNVVEIQDKALANAYTMEFNEMWGSDTNTPNASASRFGAHKTNNTPHVFTVNGTPIELYFSPSDGTTSQIIKTMNKAAESINFCILSFTQNDIGKTLMTKKSSGVKVRGVVDNNTDSGEEYDTLKSSGVDIFLKKNLNGFLHHKYAIIDANGNDTNKYVVTGSHNWSAAAETRNNENTLVIRSARLANLYLQEFSKRYTDAGGTDVLLGVVENSSQVPSAYSLSQNYPNPFNPATTIAFTLPYHGMVTLSIYDVLGREITSLVNGDLNAGSYSVQWNASSLSSGVYFYRLQSGNFVETKKLLLQK
ncbi:MAG: phospholipase D-like domain-containing protein [Bacteroidota bacterium]